MKKFMLFLLLLLVLVVVSKLYVDSTQNQTVPLVKITSYEACVDAGYPVMESDPPQCSVPDGPTFVAAQPTTTPSNQLVTVTGTTTCLISTQTEQPSTTDCVQGFMTETGQLYALDVPKQLNDIGVGESLVLTGTLTPIAAVSAVYWHTFEPLVGILSVVARMPVTPDRVPNEPLTSLPSDKPTAACFIGGCSGQLCTDDPDIVSTCEWRESYICYRKAVCERQSDGACGWTEDAALRACLTAAE